SLGGRLYTRQIQKVAYGIDDYLIIPALMASLGQSAVYIYLAKRGVIGYHLEYVANSPEKLIILNQGLYANEILDFPFSVTLAKISILFFYTRIFQVRTFRIITYIVGAIVIGHGLGVLFAAIFQCSPIAFTWNKAIIGGSCFDQQAFYQYVSPPNIITDILILILPLPYIWKLHTRIGHKLALTGVFLLGSLGTVASIFRMRTFFEVSATGMADPTWLSAKLGIWTVLESGTIIIAACLPPLWPLISKIIPRALLTNQSTNQPPRPGYNPSSQQVKRESGFSRLGESSDTVGWSLAQNSWQDLQTDRHTDEVPLNDLHRIHGPEDQFTK
ncbi:hypothetical protein N7481_000954, partial [Penicillium waksmanii]|uniref:uncharacterized protein n=1 Tax=Penicillium waksmanii TaxID=69791 RepID=UPI0025468E45